MASKATGKRLRSSEPDIKVVLKFRNKHDKAEEKTYPMYSPVLASQSNFFDAALSVNMREKQAGIVVLQDVTPEIFEKAIRCLQDPSAALTMSFNDAWEVLEFYHMYEFVGGLAFCDAIVSKHISKKRFHDFAHLVEACVTSHRYGLKKSTLEGLEALKCLFLGTSPIGAMLSTNQTASLLPIFKEHPSILPDGYISPDDLSNPIFPKYLHKSLSCNFFLSQLQARATTNSAYIQPIDSSYGIGGNDEISSLDEATFYFQNSFFSFQNSMWTSGRARIVKGFQRDWEIQALDTGVALWKCPNSREHDIPPRGPWDPVDNIRGMSKQVLLLLWNQPV